MAQDFRGIKHLKIRAGELDVTSYIEGRIPLEPFLQTHVDNDSTLQEEIAARITENV